MKYIYMYLGLAHTYVLWYTSFLFKLCVEYCRDNRLKPFIYTNDINIIKVEKFLDRQRVHRIK